MKTVNKTSRDALKLFDWQARLRKKFPEASAKALHGHMELFPPMLSNYPLIYRKYEAMERAIGSLPKKLLTKELKEALEYDPVNEVVSKKKSLNNFLFREKT